MLVSSTDQAIVDELMSFYGKREISKSKLVMALHYFLKERCDISSNCVADIEDKIEDLISRGILIEIKKDKFAINN